MKIRLNKFIAEAGISSRRGADELISAGNIKVNSQVVKEHGIMIDPDSDIVEVGGNIVKPSKNLVYYALNKPRGVISTAEDEIGRKKVTDFVLQKPRVYPVGRLDAESEGLILLTNDGKLTQELTHPSFAHEKEYEITARKLKSYQVQKLEQVKTSFENGLMIEDHLMKADKVIDLKELAKPSNLITFKLILHTGYNRQIRKMCAKIGLEVLKLQRIRIGKLRLIDLNIKPGEYKSVTREQII